MDQKNRPGESSLLPINENHFVPAMSIRNDATEEMRRFPFFDDTNKVIEQLFAVLAFPVVIPLIHWYDESLPCSFKEFQ